MASCRDEKESSLSEEGAKPPTFTQNRTSGILVSVLGIYSTISLPLPLVKATQDHAMSAHIVEHISMKQASEMTTSRSLGTKQDLTQNGISKFTESLLVAGIRKKLVWAYNMLPERLKTHRHRNSFLDRFKVVASDLPFSHTVVAHIAKDGHYYIHPDIDQNRSITPREAARLQTFPDDYYFESSKDAPRRTPAFLQIGNAVPVLLARKVADKLKETWS